ncbi:hypothetical protein HRbin36_01939 [bacterium HR36]|nr:hypothetical protein HRbin36_01939 [bacterium HR36]
MTAATPSVNLASIEATTVSNQQVPWWKRLAEFGRGLFWAAFGIAGHLVLAIVGLLLAVAVILSPILVLGGLIELIARLLP